MPGLKWGNRGFEIIEFGYGALNGKIVQSMELNGGFSIAMFVYRRASDFFCRLLYIDFPQETLEFRGSMGTYWIGNISNNRQR